VTSSLGAIAEVSFALGRLVVAVRTRTVRLTIGLSIVLNVRSICVGRALHSGCDMVDGIEMKSQ
jgi:hypothetical protein